MSIPAKWRVIGLISCLFIFGMLTAIGAYYYGEKFGWVSSKEKVSLWFLCMFLFSVFLMLMNFGVWFYHREPWFQSIRSGKSLAVNFQNKYKKNSKKDPIKAHLCRRYGYLWQNKVRLLLVTGDETAIEKLIPGLQSSHWQEGDRTVLIYGGSLSSDVDVEKYTALRKLRRGRPLDGIICVVNEELNLTVQTSDNDLRGLEKISEVLRYSAPVWLWRLCSSEWSQVGRDQQPVGITLPSRAMPDTVATQLRKLLPQLREQGLLQIAENRQNDFLLRLARELEQGGSELWATRLTPWLHSSQQRVPLRGLMFSQINKPELFNDDSGRDLDHEHVQSLHKHALTLPATWIGITEGCMRVRGHRVGIA